MRWTRETRRFLRSVSCRMAMVKRGPLKPLRIGGKQLIIRNNALLHQLAEQSYQDTLKDLERETQKAILYGVKTGFSNSSLRDGKPPALQKLRACSAKSYRKPKAMGFSARLMTYQRIRSVPRAKAIDSAMSANVMRERVARIFGYGLGSSPRLFESLLRVKIVSLRTVVIEESSCGPVLERSDWAT